jgi:hypothetical protein
VDRPYAIDVAGGAVTHAAAALGTTSIPIEWRGRPWRSKRAAISLPVQNDAGCLAKGASRSCDVAGNVKRLAGAASDTAATRWHFCALPDVAWGIEENAETLVEDPMAKRVPPRGPHRRRGKKRSAADPSLPSRSRPGTDSEQAVDGHALHGRAISCAVWPAATASTETG